MYIDLVDKKEVDVPFRFYAKRAGAHRKEVFKNVLTEFSVMNYYGANFLEKEEVFGLILDGQLPAKYFESYLWGISESMGSLCESDFTRDEFVCVSYIYLWSAVNHVFCCDGYADKAEYFLFKTIEIDYEKENGLRMAAKFIRGLSNISKGVCFHEKKWGVVEDARYHLYVLLNLADLFMQFKLHDGVSEDMVKRYSHLHALVKEKGGVIEGGSYFCCYWDESYRYSDSWFDLAEKLSMFQERYFPSLIDLIA